ncbi:MAG TPA: alpha/beta hydrolase-fold protein, partial [Pyrinomonadaceae bacterium]|nr:alpha/beta hydrolase-fold protein [Pyrinomonadaceae bacterium]
MIRDRIALILVCITLCAFAAHGQSTEKIPGQSKLIEAKIPAPSLKGNLLGDPIEQPISIYLPPGYDPSSTRRYPTVYLLHGFTSSNKNWTDDSPYSHNAPKILDALYKDSRIAPMIIVFPNGRNALSGSFYL